MTKTPCSCHVMTVKSSCDNCGVHEAWLLTFVCPFIIIIICPCAKWTVELPFISMWNIHWSVFFTVEDIIIVIIFANFFLQFASFTNRHRYNIKMNLFCLVMSIVPVV